MEAISKNVKICPVCNAEANLLKTLNEISWAFRGWKSPVPASLLDSCFVSTPLPMWE